MFVVAERLGAQEMSLHRLCWQCACHDLLDPSTLVQSQWQVQQTVTRWQPYSGMTEVIVTLRFVHEKSSYL